MPSSRSLVALTILGVLMGLGFAPPHACGANPVFDPPIVFRFQARLLDSAGNPVNTPPPLSLLTTFRIYDMNTGGSLLWGPEAHSITVVDGLVGVTVGSNVPLPLSLFEGPNGLFLSVEFGNDGEMAPRLPLASVPFTLRAASSVQADDVAGRDINPNSVTVNGVQVIDPTGAVPGVVPVGTVLDWFPAPGASLPPGFVLAAGQVVNDPASPFNGMAVPDLRSRFARGAPTMGGAGATGGAATINLSHTHGMPHTHSGTTGTATNGPTWFIAPIPPTNLLASANNHNHTFNTGQPSNGNTASALGSSQSILPPYLDLVKIIRIR